MRRLQIPLLLACAALCAAALVACGGGEKARDEKVAILRGDGFTVSMPGKPKRTTQTAQTAAGPVQIVAYITEGGEEGFSMSVAQIPKNVKADIDGAISGAAANVKGTVNDKKSTTYKDFPARDARITNAQDKNGKKGTVFVRVIVADDRLFQLQFIQEGADVTSPPASYATFLSSLKIG